MKNLKAVVISVALALSTIACTSHQEGHLNGYYTGVQISPLSELAKRSTFVPPYGCSVIQQDENYMIQFEISRVANGQYTVVGWAVPRYEYTDEYTIPQFYIALIDKGFRIVGYYNIPITAKRLIGGKLTRFEFKGVVYQVTPFNKVFLDYTLIG